MAGCLGEGEVDRGTQDERERPGPTYRRGEDARFTGHSFGSWSSSHEKPNQSSQTTDMPQSQIASSFLCLILHLRNRARTAMRIRMRSLQEAPEPSRLIYRTLLL